ncbi:hypothetical protein LCGC14_3131950 [marine sediment metagenome]|uniref:Uncharacterized protein n=1 Tax=marine sediment metagenome TaxID=412755 RepID=A0A0F8WN87_9ZZZZ
MKKLLIILVFIFIFNLMTIISLAEETQNVKIIIDTTEDNFFKATFEKFTKDSYELINEGTTYTETGIYYFHLTTNQILEINIESNNGYALITLYSFYNGTASRIDAIGYLDFVIAYDDRYKTRYEEDENIIYSLDE